MLDDPAPATRTLSLRVADQVYWHKPLLVAVCALIFLAGAWETPLTDPEEARCALIVREMLRGGDWVLPHLNGQPYFDKPAPFFWLAALGEMLTGSAALGGRIAPVLAALFAVLATYALGRRMHGARTGIIAGLILATSVEFWYIARWYRMDMPFAAAMWGAIAWFWCCERRTVKAGAPRWAAWCGFYLLCAIATLFKGPAGLGLPVLIVAGYLVLSRQPRRIVELFNPFGIVLFLLVAAPWYIAVSLREPVYVKEFLVEHNLMRFASTKFGHSWPGILYVPILLIGLLPWTSYMPAVLASLAPRRLWRGYDRHRALLWLALLVPLVFFSLSGTKIAGYILPCFPPLAVLVASVIAGWINGDNRRYVHLAAYAQVTIFALLWETMAFVGVEFSGAGYWLIVPGVACIGACLMIHLVAHHRGAFVGWMVAGTIILLTLVGINPQRSGYEYLSTRSLAALVPDADRADHEFFMWPRTRHSFRYYLDIQDPTQIKDFSDRDIDRLASKMKGVDGIYVLIVGSQNLRKLEEMCPGTVNIVGRHGDIWLIANHPMAKPSEKASGRESLVAVTTN